MAASPLLNFPIVRDQTSNDTTGTLGAHRADRSMSSTGRTSGSGPRLEGPRLEVEIGERVAEMLERLRLEVHYAPLTQKEIESRAGFSSGYLSQVLHGHIDVKVRHLLAIIDALGQDPATFFAGLFEARHFAAHSLQAVGRRTTAGARPLAMELARLYGLGLESLGDLVQRLERCEAAFRELEREGLLHPDEESAEASAFPEGASPGRSPRPHTASIREDPHTMG